MNQNRPGINSGMFLFNKKGGNRNTRQHYLQCRIVLGRVIKVRTENKINHKHIFLSCLDNFL